MQSPSIVALWNIWRRKWQPKLQVTKKRNHEWIRNLPQTPEKKLLLSATWLGFQKKRKGTWNDTQARAFRSFDVDVLKFSNLRRHHKSKLRRGSVQRLTGKSVGVSAPTESQFLRVWDELQKGVSPHSLDIDNMKAAKVYRTVFCLSEALYAKDREFARKAVVGSIRRDESNGRLLLCFSLVSKDLQRRSGVLGVKKGFGTGAKAITSATWDLQQFATPCYGVSQFQLQGQKQKVTVQAPSMDQPLCEHFAKIQRQMIIDAAADEQLSVQQMMEQTKPGSNERLFPSLKMVTHDHSHATSRILKSGFYAVPALKTILKEDVQLKTSVTQMVEHSKVFKDHFQGLNSQSEGPSSLKSHHWAQQSTGLQACRDL